MAMSAERAEPVGRVAGRHGALDADGGGDDAADRRPAGAQGGAAQRAVATYIAGQRRFLLGYVAVWLVLGAALLTVLVALGGGQRA